MKSKRIVAVASTALLSLGLAAAPVATAQADPPGPGVERGSASKAEVREAWATLKAALRAANQDFVIAVHEAQTAFRAATADQRAALTAVLTDPDATREQKATALMQFRADSAEQREIRKAAVKAAAVERKAARKAAWEAFRAAVR